MILGGRACTALVRCAPNRKHHKGPSIQREVSPGRWAPAPWGWRVSGVRCRSWLGAAPGRLWGGGGGGSGSAGVSTATPMISSGGFHTCALLTTGAVRCWVSRITGQLGHDSTDTVGDHPARSVIAAGDVPVSGTASQIAVGGLFTCALLTTGAVRCWGSGAPVSWDITARPTLEPRWASPSSRQVTCLFKNSPQAGACG